MPDFEVSASLPSDSSRVKTLRSKIIAAKTGHDKSIYMLADTQLFGDANESNRSSVNVEAGAPRKAERRHISNDESVIVVKRPKTASGPSSSPLYSDSLVSAKSNMKAERDETGRPTKGEATYKERKDNNLISGLAINKKPLEENLEHLSHFKAAKLTSEHQNLKSNIRNHDDVMKQSLFNKYGFWVTLFCFIFVYIMVVSLWIFIAQLRSPIELETFNSTTNERTDS